MAAGDVTLSDLHFLEALVIAAKAAGNTPAVIGAATASSVTANTQSGATYTLVLADASKVVRLTNASAPVLTVPPNSSVALPVGSITNVYAPGAAGAAIVAGSGVTIRNNISALVQYQEVSLRKDDTDEWVRLG